MELNVSRYVSVNKGEENWNCLKLHKRWRTARVIFTWRLPSKQTNMSYNCERQGRWWQKKMSDGEMIT